MKKAAETANNTYQLVQIKTSYTNKFVNNTVTKLNIMTEQKLKAYNKSQEFNQFIKQEKRIKMHPSFIKKNIVKKWYYKMPLSKYNTLHSSKDIKINKQNITKTKVTTYIKDGKEQSQYLVNASCEIEFTKEEYNEMIQDISQNTNEIKKLGGPENIKKIQKKLENEWDDKPTYKYIDYLKTTVISNYEKYEKKLIDNESNTNKQVTEDE